ncbi:uncharacterized protein B0I36DRAFT_366825 [Microdochium trichocladiopsis]|uniref:AA1-like domain-containing protein n=1 Tax=Microdochium trichocladiopsis TaxID=1682393 RepID=A0A9P9BLZ3_9PEZI|nr:uncharacterized protein B0I36DRAFT_366825 [Microdochium trichocladiopsis]KAH7024925.1 hypothetical protein B0I36DRAFT_366825 [Microdochium trichocladiopsis]
MRLTYPLQTLSLFWAISLASPVPAPAPISGPVLSDVTTRDLTIFDSRPIKIQYYIDYQCTKYNAEFTIQSDACYNYSYTGTHSANAVTWWDIADAHVSCYYYTGKDCQGTRSESDSAIDAPKDSLGCNTAKESQWNPWLKMDSRPRPRSSSLLVSKEHSH